MNTLLLDALACRNVSSRPPVWLMRQAGRYMSSYRKIRERYSFLEMCHDPELVAQITLLPIQEFGMDAAILFSDILVIPEALGVGLHFEEKIGPIIHRPLASPQDIEILPPVEIERLRFVAEGIRNLKPHLSVPLIGFCGAPFTLASYMIEGKSSRDLRKTKQWMLSDSTSFHRLLSQLTDWIVPYLQMQIEAGVEAIQIFDSWANYLADPQFKEFSLAYLRIILQQLPKEIPVILFCRGSSVFGPQLATIQPACVGLDWNCEIEQMRARISPSVALQGNLDPDVLCAPLPVIKKEVIRILDAMQGEPGFIFNLGHGIFPEVPEQAVHYLIECVKEYEPWRKEALATSSF